MYVSTQRPSAYCRIRLSPSYGQLALRTTAFTRSPSSYTVVRSSILLSAASLRWHIPRTWHKNVGTHGIKKHIGMHNTQTHTANKPKKSYTRIRLTHTYGTYKKTQPTHYCNSRHKGLALHDTPPHETRPVHNHRPPPAGQSPKVAPTPKKSSAPTLLGIIHRDSLNYHSTFFFARQWLINTRQTTRTGTNVGAGSRIIPTSNPGSLDSEIIPSPSGCRSSLQGLSWPALRPCQ